MSSSTASPGPSLESRLGQALAAFPQVAAAWLFGSHARHEGRAESDVDVAVLLGEGVDRHDPELLGAMAAALEHAAGGPSIDLVVLHLASQGPVFCHRVLSEGALLHEGDRAARVDFESDTYVRYFDFRPTWDIAAKRGVAGFRRWLRERR
ncbi:MAG: type VII toxin-antitoxin system MntA family adenylyltransferase antitoxin [Myxococcota bacterium]